jgi:glycosyltransferase involved in cell wall biosynthesis
MRILLIHNAYQKFGGEDVVFNMERQLLKDNGHEVVEYTVSNNDIKSDSFIGKIKVALETIWSIKQYKKVKKLINEINPDIVHVHNTFPQLSPSIYWAIKSRNIPVVQTLHNYRLTCANGLLFRSNKPCNLCTTGNFSAALKYKCYRNSLMATAPLVLMQRIHRILGTFKNKVDIYITLNRFNKEIMVKSGLPEEKMYIKPNFINSRNLSKKSKSKQFLFVGRVSPEKGLDLLLESFTNLEDNEYKLVIIGDGPEKEKLQEKYKDVNRICWKGHLPHNQVLKEIEQSRALVMPSRWYETFGMVVIEAFSVGTPALGSNHAGIPELIIDGKNGRLFTPNDSVSLRNALNEFCKMDDSVWNELSKEARLSFEKSYTEKENYKYLIDIYQKLLIE